MCSISPVSCWHWRYGAGAVARNAGLSACSSARWYCRFTLSGFWILGGPIKGPFAWLYSFARSACGSGFRGYCDQRQTGSTRCGLPAFSWSRSVRMRSRGWSTGFRCWQSRFLWSAHSYFQLLLIFAGVFCVTGGASGALALIGTGALPRPTLRPFRPERVTKVGGNGHDRPNSLWWSFLMAIAALNHRPVICDKPETRLGAMIELPARVWCLRRTRGLGALSCDLCGCTALLSRRCGLRHGQPRGAVPCGCGQFSRTRLRGGGLFGGGMRAG